jgi:hypothetical protein
MKNCSIESLEAQLNSAVAGRPAALDAIAKRIATEQATIEGYRRAPSPSAAQLGKALEALTSIEGCTKLVAILGDTKPWTASVQDQWLSDNFTVLVSELEETVKTQGSKRAGYREAAAERIGSLSKQIVLQEQTAGEVELSAMSRELAALEADLEKRERQLSLAQAAIRDLVRAHETPMPNAYEPVFKKWERARDSVKSLNFELISEAVSPREHAGAT